MNKFIASLVKMRTSSIENLRKNYEESFKTASQFLIFDEEFIPYNLIEKNNDGEAKLKELISKHGAPLVTTKYDKLLSNFYKKYSLKRDIYHIVDSISYLKISKEEQQPSVVITDDAGINDFYHINNVQKLAIYHSQPYHAEQEQLRQVGKLINDFILQPTHYWLDKIEVPGFDKIPERYWQVAGMFKKRIWGKLQRPEHLDKKIFLCLGVDLENNSLFYGLECLRTGTSKLSTEQIFKFDHFTKEVPLIEHVSLEQVSEYNWDKLIIQSEDYLSKLIHWYDLVVEYIWNDSVDIKTMHKCLIPVIAKKPSTTDASIEFNKKTQSLAVDLVVTYEKGFLKYKGKKNLSKNVSKINHSEDPYDVHSYHMDGTDKLIKIIASKSSSIQGAIITQSSIEASIVEHEKSYLYTITNLSNKRKSGILHISKGRFDRTLKTKAERHLVIS